MRVKAKAKAKALRWHYHAPGMVYAVDFRFQRPVDEAEVRRYVREYLGLRRLPTGSAVWPARG